MHFDHLLLTLVLLCVGLTLSSCSATRDQTVSPRGAMEQLLLSQAIERSLVDLQVPTLEGAAVFMEIEGLPPDLSYVKTMVAEQLGLQNIKLKDSKEKAQYLAKVIVHSLGTEQGKTLFGMPEVTQAGIFPFALPELALYKEVRQKGYARLSLNIFDMANGKLVKSIPWRAGSAYYDFYTVLFWFTFPATDLVLPPTIDSGVQDTIKRSTDISTEEQDTGLLAPTTPLSP